MAERVLWLLPSENVVLSLTDAKMEERESTAMKLGRASLKSLAQSTASMKSQFGSRPNYTQGEINEKYGPPKDLRKIQSEHLFITDKRLAFVNRDVLVEEIIIDKNYAAEKLTKVGDSNRKAMQEFLAAEQKSSMSDKGRKYLGAFLGAYHKSLWEKTVKTRPASFGFVPVDVMLLRNMEHKERAFRGVELKLDVDRFVDNEMTAYGRKTQGLTQQRRLGIGSYLSFSNLKETADKVISVVQPKLTTMREYLDSGQLDKDYEGPLESVGS